MPSTADADANRGRLACDPLNEARHLRMGSQSFNRAIVAGKFGFREDRVDLLVAGAAEQNYCQPFVASKIALSAGTSMNTARNKVMPRQLGDDATAQCATSRFHRLALHHPNSLVTHRPDLGATIPISEPESTPGSKQ
jgi:hypothetical protein